MLLNQSAEWSLTIIAVWLITFVRQVIRINVVEQSLLIWQEKLFCGQSGPHSLRTLVQIRTTYKKICENENIIILFNSTFASLQLKQTNKRILWEQMTNNHIRR